MDGWMLMVVIGLTADIQLKVLKVAYSRKPLVHRRTRRLNPFRGNNGEFRLGRHANMIEELTVPPSWHFSSAETYPCLKKLGELNGCW